MANDDAAATAEGVAVAIDVLANDSDADGSLVPASVTVTQAPADGTTSVDAATGVVTYSPDAGFSGTDSFRYTVEDDDGQASNEATVTVTVGAANAAPVANDDAAATAQGIAVAIDVLANDSDADGSLVPASVTVTQAPADGTTSVDAATGVVTYTPDAGFSGTDSFGYTVEDNDGQLSNQATVTVTVSASGGGDLPVSDDFSSPPLNPALWTLYDPLDDSSFVMTGTQAQLTVPGGLSHDLWTGRLYAPRLLQSVSNVDFEVEVKFEAPVSAKYQLNGIVVQQDTENLLRFDVLHDGISERLFAAAIVNGSASVKIDTRLSVSEALGAPAYLRVKRVGSQWTFSYSETEWTGPRWARSATGLL